MLDGPPEFSNPGAMPVNDNEQLYRDLVEHSHDLICTHDLDGVLLTVNLAAARTLGYEPGELVNRNLRELLSPQVHGDLDLYLFSMREKKLASGLIELWTKKGETRLWEYNSTLRTEGVQIPFVRAMAHDVTNILNSQNALRESEERLRLAAEVGRMYAWEWDPATDSVQRSAEYLDILGADGSVRGAVAKDYFDFVHPDDRAGLWELAKSLSPENPSYRTEYRRFRSDGLLLWLGESAHATFNDAGIMVRLVGMTADITERKRAEEQLRASEERSREIVQKSPVAMLIERGPEEMCELVNDRFVAIFGYTKEDIPSVAEWWPLAYPDEAYRNAIRTKWEMRIKEACKGNAEFSVMEAKVRCKDGSYRYVEFHFAPLGDINLVSFVDLTARKDAELELAKVGGRLINAHEEERARIARELHDDICQRMALLALGLDELEHSPAELPAGIRNRASELRERTSEVLNDLQSMSRELHSAKLELLGIAAAVRGFCKKFGQEQKAEIDCQIRDLPASLDPDTSLCLFRVLQEAVNNAAKHSGVRQFEVRLWGTPAEIHLTIADFGIGFDADAPKKSQGLGLISMQERMSLLDGIFSIRSQPGHGTTVHVCVPLAKVPPATSSERPALTNEPLLPFEHLAD
jgi:PAS domain S-box-containing protein